MYTKIPNSIFDILPALSGTAGKSYYGYLPSYFLVQRDSAHFRFRLLPKMTGASICQISDAL
jgi:hypothetical protein